MVDIKSALALNSQGVVKGGMQSQDTVLDEGDVLMVIAKVKRKASPLKEDAIDDVESIKVPKPAKGKKWHYHVRIWLEEKTDPSATPVAVLGP